MKKIKMTNAQLNGISKKIIRIGYCGAQNLLTGVNEFAYNSGVYGWNWDAYDIGGGVVVCTGYRNLTGETVKYSDLEERAEKIRGNYKMRWEEQQKALEELRAELVSRCA